MSTPSEVAAWVESQCWESVDLIVGVRKGARKWTSAIRTRTRVPIIVYEPDRAEWPEERDPAVWYTDTFVELRRRLRNTMQAAKHDPLVIYDDEEDPPELVEDVRRAINEAVQVSYHHRAAIQGGSRMRCESTIGSIDRIVKHVPVNVLAGAYAGKAGVMVGAGPSLDRNIEILAKNRDRFVVAAVNSSLKALESAGIVPDFCVVAEAKDITPAIEGLASIGETIFVPGNHVHTGCWDLPWLHTAPALSNEGGYGSFLRRTIDVPPVPIGSSGATIALGLLWLIGCDPLVLVGNDCAFDLDKMYAKDAAFGKTRTVVEYNDDGDPICVRVIRDDLKHSIDQTGCDAVEERELIWPAVRVNGWNGEPVISTLVYDGMRQWYEEVGEAWAREGRTLINANEGGAAILGWDPIRLSDVVRNLPTFDPIRDDAIQRLAQFEPPCNGSFKEAIMTQRKGARMLRDLCAEGAQLCARLREIQLAIQESGHAADLVDALSWSDVERARLGADHRPAFEVWQDMFTRIKENGDQLDKNLADLEEKI